MFNLFKSKRNIQTNPAGKESKKNIFVLGSYDSTVYALSLIDKLNKCNESNSLLFKTYEALACPKDDFKKSFYFLQDVIFFCKEDPLYDNNELLNNIKYLYSQVLTYLLDVPNASVPTDKKHNYSFGRQFKLIENIGTKELEDLTLVNWRNSAQWTFWGARYGANELGDYCRMMAQKPNQL